MVIGIQTTLMTLNMSKKSFFSSTKQQKKRNIYNNHIAPYLRLYAINDIYHTNNNLNWQKFKNSIRWDQLTNNWISIILIYIYKIMVSPQSQVLQYSLYNQLSF